MARSPRLDQQLCFSVYAAEHAFTRFYRPLLEPLGLTYPQYLVLLALWEENDIAVSAIADRLFLDSGTLTPLLKRMEQAGLVVRRRDAADERRVLVSLTARGRALEAAVATFPKSIGKASACTASEMAMLRTMLGRLRVALDGAVAESA